MNRPSSVDREHSPQILVAVCTLREAANISAMLTSLRDAVPDAHLLVVDDNSEDGTGQIANEFSGRDGNASVIIRDQRGLGGAIRTAMQYAVDGQYDWFVNMDADFSHDPAEVPKLLDRAMADPPADIVVGSRYIGGGKVVGWPLHRRLMSRMVNHMATRRLGLNINDCSGSMRCYRVDSMRRMGLENLTSEGYAVLEEVLIVMKRTIDGQFAEVPITFTDRHAGHSKLTWGEAVRSIKKIWSLG